MDTGLKDRAVIVAASSQGIGRAAAEAFAAERARVAMCARTEETLNRAAEEIRARYQAEVFSQPVDVTSPHEVHEFVHGVAKHFGRIDVCVTNAGGPPAKNFLSLSLEEWRSAVELNFLSVVNFAREVIPFMQRDNWGRFITLTSLSVKQPIQDLVLSNAVRAAVVGLVKSLANEFGRDGILVNNVAPGYTATDRLKSLAATRAQKMGTDPDMVMKSVAADVPLGRVATPAEIADAIVWLASDRASYITGQTILVDGGAYKGL
ncbi:MAG TPA: SDR family oxidoreductase [Terriglobales bacterium]|jgi:3-oxoacyl-[acyl-carrier protein] reductase|nr:SDR family oxidoreductase [Terriglobales bacterium]